MRSGNSQARTALIMYLWTATIAFPVSISAFTPLWVAGILFGAMLAFTITFQKKRPELLKLRKAQELSA
jgi:UDP-GlcNAc:undecaprenyl-phosphate GlcNAc-1-phosphate transferase